MMLDYPLDDIVFFIDDETCALLMRRLLSNDAILLEEEQVVLKLSYDEFLSAMKTGNLPESFTDLQILQEMMETEHLDLGYTSNFTGTVETCDELLPFVTTCSIEQNHDDDVILYLPLEKDRSLFQAAYPSAGELLAEIRQKLQGYLPDDFDYAAHICKVTGTYCC